MQARNTDKNSLDVSKGFMLLTNAICTIETFSINFHSKCIETLSIRWKKRYAQWLINTQEAWVQNRKFNLLWWGLCEAVNLEVFIPRSQKNCRTLFLQLQQNLTFYHSLQPEEIAWPWLEEQIHNFSDIYLIINWYTIKYFASFITFYGAWVTLGGKFYHQFLSLNMH